MSDWEGRPPVVKRKYVSHLTAHTLGTAGSKERALDGGKLCRPNEVDNSDIADTREYVIKSGLQEVRVPLTSSPSRSLPPHLFPTHGSPCSA